MSCYQENSISFPALSNSSLEILNWMIHVKYTRKEFDQCKVLAEEELKRSNNYSEYSNFILVMLVFTSFFCTWNEITFVVFHLQVPYREIFVKKKEKYRKRWNISNSVAR